MSQIDQITPVDVAAEAANLGGAPAVTVIHGDDHPMRAAVLDNDVVTTVVLLPADWHEQDPAQRWSPDPGLELVVLDDDEAALAVHGARHVDGAWVAPEPSPSLEVESLVAPAVGLGALVGALRALTPAQAEQLQQLLAVPEGGMT